MHNQLAKLYGNLTAEAAIRVSNRLLASLNPILSHINEHLFYDYVMTIHRM
jgi:hypothetical protein